MISKTFAQNDTSPALSFTIKRDGVAVNLTGYTCYLILRKRGSSSTWIKSACLLADAESGQITYLWGSGDLSDPGTFEAEVEFVDPDGKRETSDIFLIVVRKQLG